MTNYAGQLLKHCYDQLHISAAELELLRMCASGDTTPETLHAYYGRVDFDRLGSQRVCALAELSRRMEYRGVPRELLPRVRGVIRYHTALNTRQFQEFYRLLKLLNEQGIDVMLMKGGAMKTHYMPRVIRAMGDIDFWVRYEDFDKACALVQADGGYEVLPYSHHVGLKRNGCVLEMHVSFLKENQGQDNEAVFWQEARQIALQGQPVCVPTPEAMLLSILTNIFGDCVRGNVYGSAWVRWAVDCRWLIENEEIDWDKLTAFCGTYHTTLAVKTMLQILNEILSGTVPEAVLSGLQISEEESRKILWMFRMYRSFDTARRHRDGGKRLPFAWWSFRHQWYKHRLMGEPKGWLADLVSFPGHIKGLWRCETWGQFAVRLCRKIRNPSRSISTQ